LKTELTTRGLTNGMPRGHTSAASALASVSANNANSGNASTTDAASDEVVYTRGSTELLDSRRHVADFSIRRAKRRLDSERSIALNALDSSPSADERAKQRATHFAQFSNQASEVGSIRALSSCALSPDGKDVAITDWTGQCKVWDLANCRLQRTLIGHTERAHHVIYHHELRASDSTAMQLASCGADNAVRLWSAASDQPLAVLDGHTQRVNRVALHPSGRYLASTSHDETWRLWDIETGKELLVQDGHVSPVYAVAMQGDGAVVVTGALNSVALLWDLRSGKQLWPIRQHVKEVLAADFSPSGYEFATGSADNVVRVFDMRQRRLLHTIAAHQSLVSLVHYDRKHGDYLVSCGYDKKVNVWQVRGVESPTLTATLAGHEGKVTGFDVMQDDSKIVTVSFDRTFKIWH
jgi:U4/U6 small nuclear ribonucleoprotein PRP4